MIFNKHSGFEGKHAFLSASKYHWVNYDEEQLARAYSTWYATQKGTKLHALAEDLIRLKVNLPDEEKTLNMYVNDAIGYNMTPEQVLFYSPNAFGTADAISYKDGLLRIHDLKTGISKASILQPLIYSALFCLEYDVAPSDIEVELRIYQNNAIEIAQPEPDDIFHVMDKIVSFDRILEEIRSEE